MILSMLEVFDLSDESLIREVGGLYFNVEQGYRAIQTGDYEAMTGSEFNSLSLDKLKSMGKAHSLYLDLIAARDFAFDGAYTESLHAFHDLYGLLVMGSSANELYGCATNGAGCSAILQATAARVKLEIAKRILNHDHLSEMHICNGFCVGGHYQGLTLYDLALLAKMTLQAVKNSVGQPGFPSLSRSESENLPDDRPDIPRLSTVAVLEAYEWLKGRRGFIDTYDASQLSTQQSNDVFLVPQARDGSVFDGACRMGKGYKVGQKGQEKTFERFVEALAALRDMPKAYWRRPSPTSGVFGIVSAATWVSRTSKELNLDSVE